MKQVILLRKDLKLGKGKWCAQAAHASLISALNSCFHYDPNKFYEWYHKEQTKIVLAVDSEKELIELYEKAIKLSLPCSIIKDAAHTQLKEPTITAVGIGPVDDEEIDNLTGHLKLF